MFLGSIFAHKKINQTLKSYYKKIREWTDNTLINVWEIRQIEALGSSEPPIVGMLERERTTVVRQRNQNATRQNPTIFNQQSAKIPKKKS